MSGAEESEEAGEREKRLQRKRCKRMEQARTDCFCSLVSDLRSPVGLIKPVTRAAT